MLCSGLTCLPSAAIVDLNAQPTSSSTYLEKRSDIAGTFVRVSTLKEERSERNGITTGSQICLQSSRLSAMVSALFAIIAFALMRSEQTLFASQNMPIPRVNLALSYAALILNVINVASALLLSNAISKVESRGYGSMVSSSWSEARRGEWLSSSRSLWIAGWLHVVASTSGGFSFFVQVALHAWSSEDDSVGIVSACVCLFSVVPLMVISLRT